VAARLVSVTTRILLSKNVCSLICPPAIKSRNCATARSTAANKKMCDIYTNVFLSESCISFCNFLVPYFFLNNAFLSVSHKCIITEIRRKLTENGLNGPPLLPQRTDLGKPAE